MFKFKGIPSEFAKSMDCLLKLGSLRIFHMVNCNQLSSAENGNFESSVLEELKLEEIEDRTPIRYEDTIDIFKQQHTVKGLY